MGGWYVLVPVPVAMINTLIKATYERKGLFQLTGQSSRDSQQLVVFLRKCECMLLHCAQGVVLPAFRLAY